MLYERVETRIRLQLTAFLDASICQVFWASTIAPLELFVKQMTAIAGYSSLVARFSSLVNRE